jgi:hypothetical protein
MILRFGSISELVLIEYWKAVSAGNRLMCQWLLLTLNYARSAPDSPPSPVAELSEGSALLNSLCVFSRSPSLRRRGREERPSLVPGRID